jgi:hypothetical protein
VNFSAVLPVCVGRTLLQQRLRARLSQATLANAVRRALRVFFRFKYRALRGKALWCETQRVWMGRETFLYWSLRDSQIDIPWVVAIALDAPEDPADLLDAVQGELSAYWSSRTRNLPQTKDPAWMPLP